MVSSWSWSNFQSPDSAPKVTSNLPPVQSLTWRASVRTSKTSALTATGAWPAAAFRRVTSLPSFHTLISRSSRSNSAKTASNAATAPGSSRVQAVSCSSEPIVSALARHADRADRPGACGRVDGAPRARQREARDGERQAA